MSSNQSSKMKIKTAMNIRTVSQSVSAACAKIAPLWPLESFVAVNPYLGHTDQPFDEVAQRLADVGGIRSTLPLSFYINELDKGTIKVSNIEEALMRRPGQNDLDVYSFLEEVSKSEGDGYPTPKVSSYADVSGNLLAKDWAGFATDRISTWAASYF